MRVCDGCGLKMPRFRPRNNVGGKLMCDGCTPNKPGSPGVPTPGFHGSKSEAATDTGSLRVAGDQDYLRGWQAGRRANELGLARSSSTKIAEMHGLHPYSPWVAGYTDGWSGSWGGVGQAPVTSGYLKVAHDSGDGETIYHCPFCGGGQVVAGSDGSVECGFCKTHFTVQVQPEHASMPQTINGVPQHIPGMPGEVGGPAPGAGPVPGQPPGPTAPATDTGTDAFIPDGAFAPPPAIAPPVAKLYINANGVAMPEESYLRHLAIAHADDPAPVIEQVREERARV